MSAPTRTEGSEVSQAVRADSADHDECLARLRALVEAERVEPARRMVTDLASRWPDSPRVQYWARVLAPPVTSAGTENRYPSLKQDQQWLKLHRHEFPGCWLAVADGQLVAADPDLRKVEDLVRAKLGERGALLFQQPN